MGDVQLTVLPSDNPCDHDGLVVQGGFQNGGATLLDVNIPAGTSVVVVADDASGNEAWSQTVRILATTLLLRLLMPLFVLLLRRRLSLGEALRTARHLLAAAIQHPLREFE